MKRITALLLSCILCLSLCACGKSKAVVNVEALINSLGKITLEHQDAIAAAQSAYDALSQEDKGQVENYQTLMDAHNRYRELELIGDWCNVYWDFWNIEGMYERIDISLYSDMTFYIDYSEFQTGTWQVADETLKLIFNEQNIMEFTISKDGDTYTLANGENRYLPQAVYHTMLDDMFLMVDLTDENVAEYCELYLYSKNEVDAFGEATGYSKTYAMIGSKAYRDGWCCFNGKDIAIEVLFPEQQVTHIFQNGAETQGVKEAHSATVQFDIPFAEILEEISYVNARGTFTTDLTLEQLTFGRAKGKLYFIKLSNIADFPYVDENNRGITLTDGSSIPYSAWNENLWNEEHPY